MKEVAGRTLGAFSSAICSVRVCKRDYFCCVFKARSKQMVVGRSGCVGVGLLWN